LPSLKNDVNIKEMIEELSKEKWYHEMKFGKYITKSSRKTFQKQKELILSKSFKDKTVLDIGCSDGYYGFLAEDMGASKVLMIDYEKKNKINLALKYYDTKVEFKFLNIYELDKLDMQFDVILFIGLFFHLTHPLYALELVYKKLKHSGELWLEALIKNTNDSKSYAIPRLNAKYPWWECTPSCVMEMLEYVKFKNVEIRDTFNEENRNMYYLFHMIKE